MTQHIVHRGGFIEINTDTIVKISSFCFIKELLEKVITDKLLNIEDFLNGAEPLTEQLIFEFPNIPSILDTAIISYEISKRDFQCG